MGQNLRYTKFRYIKFRYSNFLFLVISDSITSDSVISISVISNSWKKVTSDSVISNSVISWSPTPDHDRMFGRRGGRARATLFFCMTDEQGVELISGVGRWWTSSKFPIPGAELRTKGSADASHHVVVSEDTFSFTIRSIGVWSWMPFQRNARMDNGKEAGIGIQHKVLKARFQAL